MIALRLARSNGNMNTGLSVGQQIFGGTVLHLFSFFGSSHNISAGVMCDHPNNSCVGETYFHYFYYKTQDDEIERKVLHFVFSEFRS